MRASLALVLLSTSWRNRMDLRRRSSPWTGYFDKDGSSSIMRRDASVGTLTGYWPDDWGSISGRNRKFSLGNTSTAPI
jgi:hypothetical protein